MMALVQVIPNKATSETSGSSQCGNPQNPDSFQSRFGHSSEERLKSSKVCFNHKVVRMSKLHRTGCSNKHNYSLYYNFCVNCTKFPSSRDFKRRCDIHLQVAHGLYFTLWQQKSCCTGVTTRSAWFLPGEYSSKERQSDPDQFECLPVHTAISCEVLTSFNLLIVEVLEIQYNSNLWTCCLYPNQQYRSCCFNSQFTTQQLVISLRVQHIFLG